MMGSVETVCFMGIKAMSIGVQVQVASGFLPSFSIVGLPDKTINEAKDRIRSVLYTLGISLPSKRITINLTPANLQKEGSHYDLPIILALFRAMNLIPEHFLDHCIALGEVGLDGSLYPIRGSLCAAMLASEKNKTLICPGSCSEEASWAGNISIIAPYHILELMDWIKKDHFPPHNQGYLGSQVFDAQKNFGDFEDIEGQEGAKRAMLIAAAGRHNILLSGPPGVGKSMLASRLASILPPLSPQEALETTMIHSLSGTLKNHSLLYWRPFRNPHHSVSTAALVGGGSKAMPGEISLAHGGVLFLDELSEFSPYSLDALRQSLETKEAVVSRVNYRGVYPAHFQLVAAMNPCRCGYLGDLQKQCHKAPSCGVFQKRSFSLPFLDRLDLYITLSSPWPSSQEKDLGTVTSFSSSDKHSSPFSSGERKSFYTTNNMKILVQKVWEQRHGFFNNILKTEQKFFLCSENINKEDNNFKNKANKENKDNTEKNNAENNIQENKERKEQDDCRTKELLPSLGSEDFLKTSSSSEDCLKEDVLSLWPSLSSSEDFEEKLLSSLEYGQKDQRDRLISQNENTKNKKKIIENLHLKPSCHKENVLSFSSPLCSNHSLDHFYNKGFLEHYVDAAGKKFLHQASKKFHLSFRGYYRVLKVAHTIALLDERYIIKQEDIAESLSYRFPFTP